MQPVKYFLSPVHFDTARKALCELCMLEIPRELKISWWHGKRGCRANEPELSQVARALAKIEYTEQQRCISVLDTLATEQELLAQDLYAHIAGSLEAPQARRVAMELRNAISLIEKK